MQNDDQMVGEILSRRNILRLFGVTGAGLVLGGSVSAQERKVDLVATPAIEEGPFFVDEELNRSDVVNGKQGVPLNLKFTVFAVKGGSKVPLEGAHVDIWHCDAHGKYSDEKSEGTLGDKSLRGYQVTDAKGNAVFKTIYPGWYAGRTPHIHAKVRTYHAAREVTHEFSTQLFFDENVTDSVFAGEPYKSRGERTTKNSNDGVYGARQADGTPVGSHLMWNLSKQSKGYDASFSIALVLV